MVAASPRRRLPSPVSMVKRINRSIGGRDRSTAAGPRARDFRKSRYFRLFHRSGAPELGAQLAHERPGYRTVEDDDAVAERQGAAACHGDRLPGDDAGIDHPDVAWVVPRRWRVGGMIDHRTPDGLAAGQGDAVGVP